jgi:DNA-binding IclR family transcriptional regulator
MERSSQKMKNEQSLRKGPNKLGASTLEKGLDVLFCVAIRGTPLTVPEMAKLLNRPSSSLYRIVGTLRKYGLLEKIDGEGHHILGKRNFMLANGRDEHTILIRAAKPEMKRLVDETGESALLAVLLGEKVICIDFVESSNPLRLTSLKGKEMPLLQGATGISMFSFLPANVRKRLIRKMKSEHITSIAVADQATLEERIKTVRKRGYAVTHGEIREGAMAIAAPILDDAKRVIGTLSLVGLEVGMNRKNQAIIGMVVESAKRISQSLGEPNQVSGDRRTGGKFLKRDKPA